MNGESKNTLTINITENLTIARDELERLMRQLPGPTPAPAQEHRVNKLADEGKLPSLAFSVNETVEILGVSKPTVYRCLSAGLAEWRGQRSLSLA